MNKKILVYDIEVSYILGASWQLYDANVVKTIREPYMMSFAYRWLGEDEITVKALPDYSLYATEPHNDKMLVQDLWSLFDEADIIIAHNGNAFDQKWSLGRFAVHTMPPPSPAQYIDTMLVCKKLFKFPSYSLNNVARYFGIEEKLSTGGIDLWVDCIENGYMDSWDRMKRYNKQDVNVLEKVYLHIRPYIRTHPNLNIIQGTYHNCPNCGSDDVNKRGYYDKGLTRRQRYVCKSCGAWSSGEIIKLDDTPIR